MQLLSSFVVQSLTTTSTLAHSLVIESVRTGGSGGGDGTTFPCDASDLCADQCDLCADQRWRVAGYGNSLSLLFIFSCTAALLPEWIHCAISVFSRKSKTCRHSV